jgi:hypothetical protein
MGMQFFFADSHDYVDPGFDFERDEFSAGRQVQRGDLYAHEMFAQPPYDGILVSRSIVGDERRRGKYSTAQMMRFYRKGVADFLRYDPTKWGGAIVGDCGAFSYRNESVPPYTVPEVVEYYAQCGFTHGVSIDHVILGYNEKFDQGLFSTYEAAPEDWRGRYDLTLKLAEEFLRYCEGQQVPFQPMGVAQGWSPRSYGDAVQRLVDMGYDYVAVGGLVPLKDYQIHRILEAIREASPRVRLHLFGFSKFGHGDPAEIQRFLSYGIESFDSTSPMIRSFRDGRCNYLLGRRWYTAIRIPHADESRRFKGNILAGIQQQQHLRKLEQAALSTIRNYAGSRTKPAVEAVLSALMQYNLEFAGCHPKPETARKETLAREPGYRETLRDRPWEQCGCRVCRELGVEVIIFRGNNRNRRRGFHNLQEFYRRLSELRGGEELMLHAAI